MSLLAPFAVIALSDFTNFEDGSVSEPSIESVGFDDTWERGDLEAEFRKSKGEKAFETLLKARGGLSLTFLQGPGGSRCACWMRFSLKGCEVYYLYPNAYSALRVRI